LGKRDDEYAPMTKKANDSPTDIIIAGAVGTGVFYVCYKVSGISMSPAALIAGSAFLAVYLLSGESKTWPSVRREVAADTQKVVQDNGYRNEWRALAQMSGIYSLE